MASERLESIPASASVRMAQEGRRAGCSRHAIAVFLFLAKRLESDAERLPLASGPVQDRYC